MSEEELISKKERKLFQKWQDVMIGRCVFIKQTQSGFKDQLCMQAITPYHIWKEKHLAKLKKMSEELKDIEKKL